MPKAKQDKVTKKETLVSTKKKIKSPKKEAVVVAKSSVRPSHKATGRQAAKAKEDKSSVRPSRKIKEKKVIKKKVAVSKTASAKGSSVSKTASAKGSSVSRKVKFSPVIKMPIKIDEPEELEIEEEIETEEDNDVRLTPKIRISKIGKLFHKNTEQKNVVGESLASVQTKRLSYVDEDDDIVVEDLNKVAVDDEVDDDDEPSFKDIAKASIAPAVASPSELADLLPDDEQIDELEELDTASAGSYGVSKTASARSYGVSKDDEMGNIAMLDEDDDEEILGPRSDKNKIILKQSKTEKYHPKIYKRLAIAFSVLAFFLLIGVLYFTLVKVTISISLNEQAATEATSIQVYDRPVDFAMPTKAVRGLVKVVGIEQSKLYQVSGNDIIGEEVIGQITLFNKYNKSQPLVASTRLLSTSGKLYRLKNSVTVPAGGQVTADVYADEAKPESAVGAEQFTLPGLWEGLQDKIYGQSQVGAIKYQQKLRRIVTQADIDNALVDLKQVLLDKVKADFDNAYDDFDYKLYQLNEATLTFTVSGKVGEEKEQLPVSMKGVVEVVAFDSSQAQEIAKAESTAKLPAGQDLIEIDSQSLKYNLTKFDPSMVMAEVGLSYNIKTRANSKASIIDKNKIIGLSEDQLKQYLNNIKDVKVYDVEFFPSFLRQVPRLTDRIEIKMMD